MPQSRLTHHWTKKNSTMELLDPDSSSTWHPDFKSFVYSGTVWPQIEAKVNPDEKNFIEFLAQVRCAPECLCDPLAIRLRNEGKRILLKRHSHVAAYHGCRPRDQETYREKGLLTSDTAVLIREARQLFDGIPVFDQALHGIETAYINHNQGKVGFLYSAIRARFGHSEHPNGSELIRSLIFRLGPAANARFRGTGTPTLIKCAIPLSWLDNHTTYSVSTSYASEVIAQLILWRIRPDDEFHGFQGGFMLARSLPPENILEFIEMTGFT